MAKANLTYKSERLLGEFLPTVYFKSILIAANESDERVAAQSNLAVKVDASIGFTKPDTISVTEAKAFIKNNLSDLYLYAWISPFQDVNISLENLNFRIFDLYKQIYNLENPSINNFTTSHLLYNEFNRAVKRMYNSQEFPHGGSVSGPFSIEDYNSIIRPLSSTTSTELDEDDIGGLLKYGMTVGDANIAAFFAWADSIAYQTDPLAMEKGFNNNVYRQIYSIDNPESLVSYLVYGSNYNGPWNKARTVHIDSIKRIYKAALAPIDPIGGAITELEDADGRLTGKFGRGDKTYTSIRDAIDDMVDESLGTIGESFEASFPSGFTPFIDGLFTDLGIGVLESSKTINSYVYDYFSAIMESFSYNHVDFSNAVVQRKKILLSDLISEDNIYGSKLTFNKTFDSDNQEIFKISNINLDFIYNVDLPETDNPVSFATDFINNDVNKLFLISCVGIDVADKIEQLEDQQFMYNVNSERNLLNSYYGNITFEEIMKLGVVPRAYFEHYIYTDNGAPFDGIPTEGLDGKLYSDEVVLRKTIIDSYKALINSYRQENNKSQHLISNMNNLEMLLTKYENSPDLVQRIKLYQKTYSDKRPGSISGRMYRDFVDLMVKINKSITSQRTVERRVSMNSIILDIRPQRVIGNNYLPIIPNDLNHLKSHPYNTYGRLDVYNMGTIDHDHYHPSYRFIESDYISHKATKMVRNLEFVQLGPDLLLESEISALAHKVMDDTKYRFTDFREETLDGTPAVGVGAAEIEAATAELLEDEAERILAYSGVDVSKVNMVVKNKGYFFFDLEKAIHTVSRMAHLVDMKKLNIFLNVSIPYKYFFVDKVTLTRWSLGSDFPAENYTGNVHTSEIAAAAAVGIDPTEVWPYMIKTRMMSTFSKNYDYPYLNWTYHKVFGSSTINGDELIHYGRPRGEFTDAGGTKLPNNPEYSCVKYVFYDIARNSEPHRHLAAGAVGLDPLSPYAPYRYTPCLKDFGSAEGWPTLTPGDDGFHGSFVRTPGIGQPHMLRKSKSYRMLGFEFTDIMDDDVAELQGAGYGRHGLSVSGDGSAAGSHTVTTNEARLLALRSINPESKPTDWYELEIVVRDKSLRYFRTIYEDIIVPILDIFEEYVDYAEELCSYNTSTDEFNQFFVDAMVEKYITTPRNRYYSEAGIVTGQASALESTLTLTSDAFAESVIQSSIENSGNNLLNLDNLDIPKYLRTIPPWVAGALLKAFIKEIFFNKTPKDSIFSVFYDLVQAFDSYDPTLGPPDPETLKFVHEMYNLTPQKGNLPAISAFIEQLEPLLKIFRLEDETIREHVSVLTGVDRDDPDFFNKVTGPDGETTHTFKQVIQNDKPISPGTSRFYLSDISDSYVFGDIEDEGGIPGLHDDSSGFSAADHYGVRALTIADFSSIYQTENRVRMMSEHAGGILDFLEQTGGGSATNWRTAAGSGKTNDWLQEYVPDYVDWQQRCKEVNGSVAGPIEEGFIEGKSSQCIYLPPKFNNDRIVEFLNLTFHEGTFLPPGASAGAGGTMAEFLRHFTHLRVMSTVIDSNGKHAPNTARWVWYPDPALDDISSARIEASMFPGSDGSPIGDVTYPEDD